MHTTNNRVLVFFIRVVLLLSKSVLWGVTTTDEKNNWCVVMPRHVATLSHSKRARQSVRGRGKHEGGICGGTCESVHDDAEDAVVEEDDDHDDVEHGILPRATWSGACLEIPFVTTM